MKITFPHMGNAYIPIKCLFDELGIEVIIPPFCSKKTLEIGSQIAPEQACLPLKINLGNYIESINMGADTILITGSCGPCRFGYYGVLQQEILLEKGYTVDVIILDPPQGELKKFLQRIHKATGGKSLTNTLKALKRAIDISNRADAFEKSIFYVRPREEHQGDTDKIYRLYQHDILEANGWYEMKKVISEYEERIKYIKIDKHRNPLKIGIIGEIYTIIEPFVNLNVEQKLGNMGVEVDRSIMVSSWIKDNLLYKALGLSAERKTHVAASPYLDRCIGGHAWECIGNAVLYSQKEYNGAVQILPFGCMPEIVAESILPSVEKDLSFPIMTLVVDELTGEAGYQTRLEAFVDLLKYRNKEERKEWKVII